ncbi:hypothetical protein [Pantoea sp. 18069]|uniref:hypothetical protein n=1 Tax=Pantoea sp. 18069 TaxID=2681415 RepID=UPI00135B1BD5|nr:hypothetical protein [Pantoea sp. 18069]
MLESERLAVAAHVHVLLRRRTGRVTDTEWMACNADYAREVVRFCRLRAQQDALPELGEWADKLERAMQLAPAAPAAPTGFVAAPAANRAQPPGGTERYVGGIR